MLNSVDAGVGLTLIAAGVCVIMAARRRVKIVAAADSPARFTESPQALPVLLPPQLFELTGTTGLLATIEAKLAYSRENFEQCVQPLLNAFADFVQQLPVAESGRPAQAGGLLIRALNRVDVAVTFRCGQILPRHAAPEDIMRLEHRWTYAVVVAALLHDVGKLVAGLRVTLDGPNVSAPKVWEPRLGSISQCGGTQYCVEVVARGEGDQSSDANLGPSLFKQWIPEAVLSWLSTEPELVSELMATLSETRGCGGGAIGELVSRAQSEWGKRHCLSDLRADAGPSGASHQVALPASAHELTAVKAATMVVECTPPSSGSDVSRPKRSQQHQEEYLDEVVVFPDGAKPDIKNMSSSVKGKR